MTEPVYPVATRELAQRRNDLAPATHDAFQAFSRQVFADGALDQKTKQLIAVAVAHVTQCPYCIQGHTRAALRKGASEPELMEAIWVAAEMRAGGAYAHSVLALETTAHSRARAEGAEPRDADALPGAGHATIPPQDVIARDDDGEPSSGVPNPTGGCGSARLTALAIAAPGPAMSSQRPRVRPRRGLPTDLDQTRHRRDGEHDGDHQQREPG